MSCTEMSCFKITDQGWYGVVLYSSFISRYWWVGEEVPWKTIAASVLASPSELTLASASVSIAVEFIYLYSTTQCVCRYVASCQFLLSRNTKIGGGRWNTQESGREFVRDIDPPIPSLRLAFWDIYIYIYNIVKPSRSNGETNKR